MIRRHTKYKGVQRVSCDPFPKKFFYGSNRMDLVFVRPPGVQPGGFTLTSDSVRYCQALLLFSASFLTDTGSKSFDCAFVSTLETYKDPANGD